MNQGLSYSVGMAAAMRDCMLVAFGGMLGALARYGIGISATTWLGRGFPWGTLIVNVAGCFAMGIVLAVLVGLEMRSADPIIRSQVAFWQKGIAIGFLGGLTTFSSFGADTLRQLTSGQVGFAFSNMAANVVLSLFAVWCGMALMQAID